VQKNRLLKGGQKKFYSTSLIALGSTIEMKTISSQMELVWSWPFITTPIFQNDYDFFWVFEIIGINYSLI
jgi:hypothetical protein